MEKLFIYGTLAPGRPNEHKMSDIKGTWQVGVVKGKLHEEGWGAQMGYPGIELDENGDNVEGFLFISDELYKKWDELDSFEGKEYERVLTQVRLLNEETVEAYIYALKK